MYHAKLTAPPWFPPIWGHKGLESPDGFRVWPRADEFYVDYNHPEASDDNDGVDPNSPLSTVQAAADRVSDYDIIKVLSMSYEHVVTRNYVNGANYVTLMGVGFGGNIGRYSPFWESDDKDYSCLDLRAIGWNVTGFRFGAPINAACVELRHTDSNPNDIAIRSQIYGNYFDGLTVGLHGVESHGCYDVWIYNNFFSLFHNVGGTATALITTAAPLAIPYRNHIFNNYFFDNDNHVHFDMNGSRFGPNNWIQKTGYAYTATLCLDCSAGDDNIIGGNLFEGDYSIAGGFVGGINTQWLGNLSDDLAAVEVGDNGLTIDAPA